MYNTGSGPAVLAANSWNSILDGVGPEFQVTDIPCGSGPDCIWMEETTDSIDGCAALVGGTPNYSTGEMVASSTMKLPASTWDDASAARLQRTVAHELGHALGMNHNTCTGNQSVESIVSSCTNASGMSIEPTLQDALQTTTSPYGNGQEKVCGF